MRTSRLLSPCSPSFPLGWEAPAPDYCASQPCPCCPSDRLRLVLQLPSHRPRRPRTRLGPHDPRSALVIAPSLAGCLPKANVPGTSSIPLRPCPPHPVVGPVRGSQTRRGVMGDARKREEGVKSYVMIRPGLETTIADPPKRCPIRTSRSVPWRR